MATEPVVPIYCAAGKRFATIAVACGFAYGAQPTKTFYHDNLYFADQDWKNPDRAAYMAALDKHRPFMATVLDLERPDQLDEVMSWAEDAARYVESVLIIPKYSGAIAQLPRSIGGKPIRLAYSVPTRYGGTAVPLSEFAGWPLHLLGGSCVRQMDIYRSVKLMSESGLPCPIISSVDGNYHQLASSYNRFWSPDYVAHATRHHWPTLQEVDGVKWGKDAPYEAFRRSCVNIVAAWKRLSGEEYADERGVCT